MKPPLKSARKFSSRAFNKSHILVKIPHGQAQMWAHRVFCVQPQPASTKPASAEREHVFRDERATAVYLGVSVETLRTWRKQNRGPRFRKFGRCVRYSIRDLQAFAKGAPSGGQRIA